jgi:hypothetical protein
MRARSALMCVRWPSARRPLTLQTCQSNFDIHTDGTLQYISFYVVVSFNESIVTERNGVNYTDTRNVESAVQIELTFPLQLTLAASNIQVFSRNSIAVDAQVRVASPCPRALDID